MNKTFCWLILVSFFISTGSIAYLYRVNPPKWVPMVVSDNFSYMDSGSSYIKTEYCKVNDPFKCLSKREMRSAPKFEVGTKVQLHISENLEFDADTIGVLNLLQFVSFITLCVICIGAFFIGSVYLFVSKDETTIRNML